MGTRAADITHAVEDVLLGKVELTAHDVPMLAGVEAEDGRHFWQALGFPTAPRAEAMFSKRDVEALHLAARIGEFTGPTDEMVLQMARTSGQALSRVAHMHVLSVADRIAEATRSPELTNSQAADRIAAIAESLVRSHEGLLTYIWRRHVFAAISQAVAGATGQMDAAERTTVGFADLVGYTAISQQVSDDELVEIVNRFEKIAYQEIPERGGRIVKTLGDEVMFSNTSPREAGETALAIAAACKADPMLPDVRVGVAVGSLLAFEGDFYGPTVNLASRLAGIATPGTVIISDELAERLKDDDTFRVIEIRDVKLKGIGRTKPRVLRWREAAPDSRK